MPEAFQLVTAGSLRDNALQALLVTIVILCAGIVVLAGYAVLLRLAHVRTDARRSRLGEAWREPLLVALTNPAASPAVHEAIAAADRLRFVSYVLDHSRRVRGDERDRLETLAAPYLGEVTVRASSGSEEVRARAVQTLGALGLPEHSSAVQAALDDPSPLVAMVAARALCASGEARLARAVLERLGRFAGWHRQFLAAMLASVGSEITADLRAGLSRTDRSPWERSVHAEALQLQGDFGAADVAAWVVGEADDRELLASCLRLIGDVGRPEHAEAVKPLCSSDDPAIRSQALRALGAVGGAEDLPRLLEAMADAEPWPAIYAARGARDAGGRDELERLAVSDDPRATLASQVLREGGA